MAGFRQALRELGYIEGQNIVDYRFSEGRDDRLADLAAELVQLGPDALVALGDLSIRAVKSVTTVIPIVLLAGDPVPADPTSIATLHDEAIAQMAIALRLVTLAFGPLHSVHDRAHSPSLGTVSFRGPKVCGLAAGGRWIRTIGPATEKLRLGTPCGFRVRVDQLGAALIPRGTKFESAWTTANCPPALRRIRNSNRV